MSDYYEFTKKYLEDSECKNNSKYCSVGRTFCISNQEVEGLYWFYENENFIIDIHDFFIKKEIIHSKFPDLGRFISLHSSYIISANGEALSPYQNLSANSFYILNFNKIDKNYRFLLHPDSPYLGVSINFKKQMTEKYLPFLENSIPGFDILINRKSVITRPLETIAKDILNCKMTSPKAELFLESKAKEWINIVANAFLIKNEVHISKDDDKALKNVANYIDDHYSMNISQKTLEQIAVMSGTKLKKLFKEKFQYSITEYTQRKRVNMAENLLLNSSLKIQDVARAVGYSSHSKFSACFKKYRGIHPKDIKKTNSGKLSVIDCICDKRNPPATIQ